MSRWICRQKRSISYHSSKEGVQNRHMCFKDEIESKNDDQHDNKRIQLPSFRIRSDVHLEETPSIDQFQLPPPLWCHENKMKMEWTWLDPHWFVSTAHINQHDSLGWQYGDSQWQHWRKQPYGFGIFTRRRLWIRRAKRTERWVSTESVFSEDLFSDWESTISSLSDKSTL
ncbi:hypothetical protein K501DRAFT_275212 [Backusella circina FSU 941]|nr:hypothetical protein K501DRAFT_275212 [Backusella circina FSU 941]